LLQYLSTREYVVTHSNFRDSSLIRLISPANIVHVGDLFIFTACPSKFNVDKMPEPYKAASVMSEIEVDT
jgi:hypothetical protein